MIDGLCETRDWSGLVELRDRCVRAIERGRQLWPAAHHAEYRLALEAPGEWAARVLVEGAGRFALGPLAEVAACTHPWAELAPHAPATPTAALCAQERVVRGEDLRGIEVCGPDPLELPRVLLPWEPVYAVAQYRSHAADFPAPQVAEALQPVTLPATFDRVERAGCARVLADLTAAWGAESEGSTEVASVRGDARAAVAALGHREARLAAITGADALALMAWAAASGGAHGRRRGAATGRLDALLALAVLTGRADEWPPDWGSLGRSLDDPAWFVWDAGGPVTGWALHLALEGRGEGIAYALAARDPA